jgi:hypothetical protein
VTIEAGDSVVTSREAGRNVLGRIVALWRYPVKSMQGELVNASVVDQRVVCVGSRTGARLCGNA